MHNSPYQIWIASIWNCIYHKTQKSGVTEILHPRPNCWRACRNGWCNVSVHKEVDCKQISKKEKSPSCDVQGRAHQRSHLGEKQHYPIWPRRNSNNYTSQLSNAAKMQSYSIEDSICWKKSFFTNWRHNSRKCSRYTKATIQHHPWRFGS